MDFEALVGRAAQYSPDAMLVVQQSSDDDCEDLVVLYANPVFRSEVSCHLEADIACACACACTCILSEPNFSNQALLSVTNCGDVSKSFRVSVSPLPEDETGKAGCFLLSGRASGDSLSEGRERLYSDIARKFIDLPTDDAVRSTVRAAGLYFGVERCFAARVDLSSGMMEVRYSWIKQDDKNAVSNSKQPIKTMCSWVMERLRQNEVVQVDRIDGLPPEASELADVLNSSGAKAAVLAPVLLARGTLWFIGIHCLTHTRVWNKEDVTTFKVIGDLLGNAFTQTETVWSLKETERRFSDVGANIPGVVFQMRRTVQGQLSFSYISQGVRDLTGWGPVSMMADPVLLENLVLREDRGRYREAMERAGSNFDEWSVDVRIKHRKTEETKWVRGSGRAHKGANGDTVWNGLLLDISERRKAEEALRISEDRLRKILGTSPIAIGISDIHSFKLLFANKRLAEMYQIPKANVIGYDTRKFYAEPRLHRKHWVQTRREKSLSNVETECCRSDGQQFWAQITTRLIDYGGRQAILWWAFDITEHKRTREALAHLAHHDVLTGLANRRLFEEYLQNAVFLAKRSERPGVLFYFDLDGFKAVNDVHGHDFGDWVLIQVATRLRKVLRDSDIAARLGGDEFAIVAHNIDDIRSIESVVDKMQEAISQPYIKGDKKSVIGLSIGVVRFFGHEKSIAQIVTMADGAMYDAKQSGKGTYRLINMPASETKAVVS